MADNFKHLYEMTWEKWIILQPSTQDRYARASRTKPGDPIQKLLDEHAPKKQKQAKEQSQKRSKAPSKRNIISEDDSGADSSPIRRSDFTQLYNLSKSLTVALSESCRKFEKDNEKLQVRSTKLEKDNKRLQDRTSVLENNVEDLEVELSSQENEFEKKLEANRQELQEVKSQLEKRIKSLEEDAKMDKQKIEELHEKLTKVQGEVDTLKKNEQIFKEVKDILLQLADKNTKGSAFYQKIDQLVAVGERIAASETSS
jgi:chromosome segregation ATPase